MTSKHEKMACGKEFRKSSAGTCTETCRGKPLHAKYPPECRQCKRFVP